MISSFGAILAWKSDDDDAANTDDDYDGDRKIDPYMSPSYAGDTKMIFWVMMWGNWDKVTWSNSTNLWN